MTRERERERIQELIAGNAPLRVLTRWDVASLAIDIDAGMPTRMDIFTSNGMKITTDGNI